MFSFRGMAIVVTVAVDQVKKLMAVRAELTGGLVLAPVRDGQKMMAIAEWE